MRITKLNMGSILGLALALIAGRPQSLSGQTLPKVDQSLHAWNSLGSAPTVAQVRPDVAPARDEKKEARLRQLEAAKKYANGSMNTPRNQRAFERLLSERDSTSTLTAQLASQIPELGPENFRELSSSLLPHVLTDEGELQLSDLSVWAHKCQGLPKRLARIQQLYQVFLDEDDRYPGSSRSGAGQYLSQLTIETEIAGRQLRTLAKREKQSLAQLQPALQQHVYLHAFVQNLYVAEYVQRVKQYQQGFTFAGGTLADLVAFLDDNQLGVAPRGEAAEKLASFTDLMMRQAAQRYGLQGSPPPGNACAAATPPLAPSSGFSLANGAAAE